LYKAPGNTPVSLKSSKSASILCLTSLKIGVIISTHPYPFYKAKEDELYKDYIMIFNSSIIADTQGANNGDGEITKKVMDKQCWKDYYGHWQTSPYPKRKGISSKTKDSEFRTNKSFPWHRTPLYKTSNRSLRLCPSRIQLNNIIVILYGGHVPFILRKRDGHGRQLSMTTQYELIRECYIQSYMYGAAIHEQEHGTLSLNNLC
jgi:hypothetical protein